MSTCHLPLSLNPSLQVPPDMLSMDLTTEMSADSRTPAGEGEREVQHLSEFYSSSTDQDQHTPEMETAQ